MKKKDLENLIFECYLEVLKEDKDKESNMIFQESEQMPDATDQMLAKFPTLEHCLQKLTQLERRDYMKFFSSIDWISPNPSEFRVNLTNGQNFTLKWTGKDFQATIAGKRYELGQLADYQRALTKLSILFKEGPAGTPEEDDELGGDGPGGEGGGFDHGGGGGGGNFPGEEGGGGDFGGPEGDFGPEGGEGGSEEGGGEEGNEEISFEDDDNTI